MNNPAPAAKRRRAPWPRIWFDRDAPVSRGAYLGHGLALCGLKFALDTILVQATVGRRMPLDLYVIPLIDRRQSLLAGAPEWLFPAIVLTAIPFLAVAVSMSTRRAVDAGLPRWVGLGMLLPVLQLLTAAFLSLLPPRKTKQRLAPSTEEPSDPWSEFPSAMLGAIVTLALHVVSVFLLGDYGLTLFVATPFLLGLTSALVYNRRDERSLYETWMVTLLSLLVVTGSLLLLALEGVICILMAAPLAVPLAFLGATFGRLLAIRGQRVRAAWVALLVCVVPMLGADATRDDSRPTFVVTELEIDAPPETVWNHVIGFSELPAADEIPFRLGIAHPVRARIEGTGPGAIRYCEFSTGAFVEPITLWDPPVRLAFDVVDQPPPMHEWSPYERVFAPHLEGALRSQRGQFLLERLPDGGTRLVGTTWYTLDMAPGPYWRLWSDTLIHGIHRRVLRHIRDLAEREAGNARLS